MMRHQFRLFALLVLVVLLASCAAGSETSDSPNPEPTSTLPPEPTATAIPPTSTPSPTPFPPFRDEFTQLLEPGWTWFNEDPFLWNFTEKPGFLRIHLSPQDDSVVAPDAGALAHTNTLLRHPPEGNFEITTRVLFSPFANFHSAGLIILQDEGHALYFSRAMCFMPALPQGLCVGNGIYFDYNNVDEGSPESYYAVGSNYATKTVVTDEAYLKLTREGRVFTAFFSDDGETWRMIGRHETDLFPEYVGIRVSTNWNHSIWADFDYFTLETLP